MAERFPASFAQERAWFLDRLGIELPLQNIARAIRLDGRLDVEALERALAELVRRHDVLRTTFALEETGLVQIVHPPARLKLSPIDLSSLPESTRQQNVDRALQSE